MVDRLVLPLLALLALAMIGLALLWPVGQGARSPSLPGRQAAGSPAASAASAAPDAARLRGQQPASGSGF